MGRSAIRERVQNVAETLALGLLIDSEQLENLRLNVRTTDSDGARGHFGTVADYVVAVGTNPGRIGIDVDEVFFFWPGEGVVDGVPTVVGRVPFNEREVHNPAELKDARVSKTASLSDLVSKSVKDIVARHAIWPQLPKAAWTRENFAAKAIPVCKGRRYPSQL